MTNQMYVFLEEGDINKEGDEYYSFLTNEWKAETVINNVPFNGRGLYRRPISQPTAPDTVCAQLRQVGDVAMTTGGLTKREWFAGMALSGLLARQGGDYLDIAFVACRYSEEITKLLGKENN